MIHKYALIAEYEFDDENGEYTPPSSLQVNRYLNRAIERVLDRSGIGLTETHFEVARGTLHDTFGVGEAK